MCGIAGFVNLDGKPASGRSIRAMTDALFHRGPDDGGVWLKEYVALGHRRLSIRDLSTAGHQPMSDRSGRVTVTYNGEIYNYAELRRELEREYGIVFRSTCDTEILPIGYIVWGEQLFARIEGIFALALWDDAEKKLVLARDPVGVKPLFYSCLPGVVRFASEIKSLLATPIQPREFDEFGLHTFFAAGYAGPTSTTMRHIHQVSPGTVLTLHNGELKGRKFWRLARKPDLASLDEAVEAFVPLFQTVVSQQLASDVPIGVLQSGGIDSTLVSYCLPRNARVELLTAAFKASSHDETELAALAARGVRMPHHVLCVDDDLHPEETLKKVVFHFDGQVIDESAGPLLLLTQHLKRTCTVALSGDGADEFFGGYPTYRASRLASWLAPAMPKRIAGYLGKQIYYQSSQSAGPLPMATVLSRFLLGIAAGGRMAHAQWRRCIPQFLLPRLYGPALRPLVDVDPLGGYVQAIQDADGPSHLDKCLIADQSYHLPGGLLRKTDAMSMANGVEIRVPFLDRRIIEFSSACDISLLTGGRSSKPLLRQALRKLGAPDELWSASKRGFNNPLDVLMRGPLRRLCLQMFEASPDLLEPYLRPDAVRSIWREHDIGRANHSYTLWPILHFAMWRARISSGDFTGSACGRDRVGAQLDGVRQG